MTNIELIKILKKSVDKFGQLPVDMNIINYVDSSKHYNLEDVLYELGDSDESYDYFENALVDLMGRSNNTTGSLRIVQNLYIPGR